MSDRCKHDIPLSRECVRCQNVLRKSQGLDPLPVPTPTPPETVKGWGCGCPQDFKHTACPLHAKSDVYLIVCPAPVRGLDFEAAFQERLDASPYPQAALHGYRLPEDMRERLNAQLQARIAEATEVVRKEVGARWQMLLDAERLNSDNRVFLANEEYAALRTVVREWSDAWFAYNGIVNAIHATGPEIEAADVRLDKAAHALASYSVEAR